MLWCLYFDLDLFLFLCLSFDDACLWPFLDCFPSDFCEPEDDEDLESPDDDDDEDAEDEDPEEDSSDVPSVSEPVPDGDESEREDESVVEDEVFAEGDRVWEVHEEES